MRSSRKAGRQFDADIVKAFCARLPRVVAAIPTPSSSLTPADAGDGSASSLIHSLIDGPMSDTLMVSVSEFGSGWNGPHS